MPTISVIVPVYKVEPWLWRCVDSILAQTYTDFELILVDDGSPDNCGAICDEYAAKDSRVHVIHQKNGGLSAARNAGIDWVFAHSDSRWLTFVDSDDWLYPETLQFLLRDAAEKDIAKQACLYAMMKQYRLVWDYMITVIGKKFEEQNLSYGKMDLNVFFMRLQEQDDEVASWADSTVKKLKQVLNKILIENEYIDNPRATRLNPVLISSEVENAIRANGDEIALPAFNCFF